MVEQTSDTLTQVFRDVFDDDTIVLRPDFSADDRSDWDSLTHIRLLLSIERAFQVKFTVTEVGSLKNVGELTELIERKRASSPGKK